MAGQDLWRAEVVAKGSNSWPFGRDRPCQAGTWGNRAQRLQENPSGPSPPHSQTSPTSGGFLQSAPLANLHLCDLEDGAILQTWPWDGKQAGTWTDGGRILMHRLPGATNYFAWDVVKNRPNSEMAHVAEHEMIHFFFLGNKQALVHAGREGKSLIVDVADGKAALRPDCTWPKVVIGSNLLRAWMARVGVMPSDTDDLAQEALLVVFREVGGFERRHKGAIQAWLRTILVHRVRD